MQLGRKNTLLISLMTFSLFFGAGNLIFPPLLGQAAGTGTAPAFLGFLVTAVVLPVLGVIVVGKFGGLTNLAGKVGAKFSLIFTLLIYLSIGPGLGIPRAGSVPFEMAIMPYLPEDSNYTLFMLLYTLVFFAVVLWLCLNPGKLVKRIGSFLTPALLLLISALFIAFLFNIDKEAAVPDELYLDNPFLQGFVDGYQTMDTIAALNFGLVIALTLTSFGIKEEKGILRHTVRAGIFAGTILTAVYLMLTVMGTMTGAAYPNDANGALILRRITYDLFGNAGAILLAAIFTLACLTTCVGLTNSISAYFAGLFKRLSYTHWVIIITSVSFLICNLGLNMILSVSVPVLNAIYPVSIVLIILGLFDKFLLGKPIIYRLCIFGTAVISVIYAIDELVNLGFITNVLSYIPLYSQGFGWVIICAVMLIAGIIITFAGGRKQRRTN